MIWILFTCVRVCVCWCVLVCVCVCVCACVCQDARAHKLDLTILSAAIRIWYVHLLVCMNCNESQTPGAVGRHQKHYQRVATSHHKHLNILKNMLAKHFNAYYEAYYEPQRN